MKITVDIGSQEILTPNKMNISNEFEIMLSLLFGSNNHHGDVDIVGNYEWKKKILKIVGAIEKSIQENLNFTDQQHKQELDRTIKQLIAKLKTSNNLNKTNHDSILGLTKIIFSAFAGVLRLQIQHNIDAVCLCTVVFAFAGVLHLQTQQTINSRR